MKILIVTVGHYIDQPGGSQKIAFDEAIELKRRGEDVWVLAPGTPSQAEYEQKDGIHLLRYMPEKVAPWNPDRRIVHQKAATAVLARHLPQVDAIHGFIPLSYLAALDFYGDSVHCSYTICSPATMEMAIAWRNSSLLRRLTAPFGLAAIKKIEANCFRRSHVVTAMSQYTIDCIGRIHGEEVAKSLKLVPGWVDTSHYVPVEDRGRIKAQLGWPTDIPVLFTLRRLVPRMGLDRLLDACYRLHREGLKFHLVIAGTGSLRGRLEEQTNTLGIGHSVTFLGRVEDRELPLAYAACDAFVLPTTELECFGLIALEALSAGRPVLATPVGAIPEIVRQFELSWLARSAEVEDIAVLLRQYLTGRMPIHAPSQLHDQIHRDYSRERVLDRFIKTTIGRNDNYAGSD
jgi:glycosyltransferase involved in cell wall biosynthesis